MHPCSREVPSAHVDAHILSPRIVYSLAYGSVAFLLVKIEMFCVLCGISTTEVNLYEVELQTFEEVIGILLVVSVKTDTISLLVLVPEVAARVVSCV